MATKCTKPPINLPLQKSVTGRIKDISQPYGGYLPVKSLTEVPLTRNAIDEVPTEPETVHPSIVGMAVDYLTRLMTGTPVEEAFSVSLLGAAELHESDYADDLLRQITGLDEASISAALQIVGYDTYFRGGKETYRPVQEIVPDPITIKHVAIMVRRSVEFIKIFGPKVLDGFTFEGAYTEFVSAGDGDFLTKDTLWDFKVSKTKPKKEHTLQLLMYWQMGLRSIHPEFKNVTRLGIYNPRLNTVYVVQTSDIDEAVIKEVADTVIGYDLEPL